MQILCFSRFGGLIGLNRNLPAIFLGGLLFFLASLLSCPGDTVIFSENFDALQALPSGWTRSNDSGVVGWDLTSSASDTAPNAFRVPLLGYGASSLISPSIHIPKALTKLSFHHSYQTDYSSSRGSLEISVGGAPFNEFVSAGGYFLTNGYGPYSYSSAWSGNSPGFITTEAYLPVAALGTNVQLRWTFYNYGSSSGFGWIVDTISVVEDQLLLPNDISVTIAATPGSVAVGANLYYTVTVTNTGPTAATAVVLTNILPANVTLISSTPSVGNCTNLNGTLVCDLGTLAGQSTATLQVVVQPTALGMLTNQVAVTRAEPDAELPNNFATLTTLVSAPVLYAEDVSVAEGNSGSNTVTIPVHLSTACQQTVTVQYGTVDGSATAGQDYNSASGTLTFAPGELTQPVTVSVLGDQIYETNEVFYVQLSQATNATIAPHLGTVRILDNDPVPNIVVFDSSVVEGNSGYTNALFTALLTAPCGVPVLLTYSTSPGSAGSPADFQATNGTVVFSPGTTSQSFVVPVKGDLIPENIEYFNVNLAAANANLLSYGPAYGFIVDDDGLPGQLDHFSWAFISNSMPLGQPFPVTLTALDYNGNVVSDYTGPANLSAGSFQPGSSSTVLPSDENITWSYYWATVGYAFTPSRDLVVTHFRTYFGGKVSLWTDTGDLLASVTLTNLSGAWTETPLPDPVQLHAGTRYRLAVYSNDGRVYNFSDYYYYPVAFNDGTIDAIYQSGSDSFPNQSAGSSLPLVDLKYTPEVIQPVAISPTEASSFINGTWSGQVTVLENKPGIMLWATDGMGHEGRSNPFALAAPEDIGLTLQDVSAPIGVSGHLTYLLTVTNTGPSTATDVVITNYLPAGVAVQSVVSSQGTSTQAGATITGSLGDLPGSAAATLEITVIVPAAPTVLTNLAVVSRAEPDFALSNNVVTGVTPVLVPTVSIDDVGVMEGDVGFGEMDFKVHLAPAAGAPVTVQYVTAPGTADATDFVATNGLLTLNPGEAEKNIVVWIRNDLLNEDDETLALNLSNLTGAIAGRVQATGTITNDDPLPSLYLWNTAVVEGNSGATNALMTVQLSVPSGRTITVVFGTSDATATSESDYISTNGILVFAPGVSSQSFAVSVLGDTKVEDTEYFYVTAQSYSNVMSYYYSATTFILNDDGLPGNVDHFAWDAIASPQSFGKPLAVTLAARDFYDETATNFSGPVGLSAFAVTGEISDTILNSPEPYSTYSSYYTLGYAFTPDTDLQVTYLRYYSGYSSMKILLWTDDGTLLTSQTVSNAVTGWQETGLPVPVPLTAGNRYRVGVTSYSGGTLTLSDVPPTFDHGTIDANYYSYSSSADRFPIYQTSGAWPLVDLRYTVPVLQPLPLAPTNTAPFTNGVWSGDLMLAQPGAKVLLRAEDEVGHVGWSTPFNLGTALGIRQEGTNVILSWPGYASGYVLESASDLTAPLNWVSNLSPASVVGGWYMVTNPVTPGANLFRLRWP